MVHFVLGARTGDIKEPAPILALANASIAQNRKQFQKDLLPSREGGALPALIPLRDVNQQAEFVAQRVLELREEGIPLDERGV